MARVKVITKKDKQSATEIAILGDDSKEIGRMMNQMMGVEDGDVDVVRPKYFRLRQNIYAVGDMLKMISVEAIASELPNQAHQLLDIRKYANRLISESQLHIPEQKVSEDIKEINTIYKTLAESETVKILFTVLNELQQYDLYLTPKDGTSYEDGNWILDIPGISFTPFSKFSDFNLKYVWTCSTSSEETRKIIYMTLCKLLVFCRAIVKIILSPNIDKEKFSSFMCTQIRKAKKYIHGCDDAFSRILDSTSLLTDNFDEYYKGFIESKGEATFILQSFVIDVSKKHKTSPRVTLQFHKIMQFYRKQAQGRKMPDGVQKVMDNLAKVYEIVEKNHSEQMKKEKTDEPQTENGEEAEEEEETEESDMKSDKKERIARYREGMQRKYDLYSNLLHQSHINYARR
jgi:hypothetical protein